MTLHYLNKRIKVKVDRPLGSKHPQHNLIYPVNYGYLPNTLSGDWEEIDAYILGEFDPLETFTGKVIAIVKRNDDVEDKLVVSNKHYTTEQISALIEFQERFFKTRIITSWDVT
ncbi:inorganic pyrophosphatase [Evansella caseinilytica]|uniref:inorganic diphosphatase n=1 Tax=Evansella caseinilytica TaxID=1503961 RepID=A0A1H3HPH7_9BACI|nr:inorganic diphosphatase [Evansella caseinilytica]SDY17362.1 inorganic pyrophosphatase [Evansella caseinilytica]